MRSFFDRDAIPTTINIEEKETIMRSALNGRLIAEKSLCWAGGCTYMTKYTVPGNENELGPGPFSEFELVKLHPCNGACSKKNVGTEEDPHEIIVHDHECRELFNHDQAVRLVLPSGSKTSLFSGSFFKQ